MKLMFKALPLNRQIMLLIAILGIFILFISLYSTFTYMNQMSTTVERNQELYFNQLLLSAETNFEEIGHISSSIAYNQLVQNYLLESDPNNKFTLYQHMVNLLNNTKTLNNTIIDIALIGENRNSANLSGDISIYYDLYKKIPDNTDTAHFFGKTDYYIADNRYIALVVSMPVYNLSSGGKNQIGVVFVTINPSLLFHQIINTDNVIANEILFSDANNQLILGDDEFYPLVLQEENESKDEFIVKKNNQVYKVKRQKVNHMDGTIFTYYNKSAYDNSVFSPISRQTALMITAFIAVSIFLMASYKSISQSLLQLNGIMNKIGSGKWSGLSDRITLDPDKIYSKEVIATLTAFNEMLDEINRLNNNIFKNYTKMYDMEMLQKKTEIAFLRSQINPHFLYNTLSLICGMASENQTQGVIEVTQSLSRIFRYSIHGDDVVTLGEELEVIRNYVLIQTNRFEDRFTVEYDCADITMSALIPRMIIQPLVENAIVHGLEKSLKKGKLVIGSRFKKDENVLVIWVYDTGVGMSHKRLESIREYLNNNAEHIIDNYHDNPYSIHEETQESIGLCNVNRRISLQFGQSYRLHIDSEENVGTNIQIKIPFTNA